MPDETLGKHIGNIKASKGGKGINLHIFKGNIYGTIPLSRIETLVDEMRINGKSNQVIPVVFLKMNKEEIKKEVINGT
jgi:hypothetical protein